MLLYTHRTGHELMWTGLEHFTAHHLGIETRSELYLELGVPMPQIRDRHPLNDRIPLPPTLRILQSVPRLNMNMPDNDHDNANDDGDNDNNNDGDNDNNNDGDNVDDLGRFIEEEDQ